MAFPNDLADVAVFKIHPAIGCARLANNDEYYEFFDYEARRSTGQALALEYMSVRDGKHWIKRQAVRFRIFAYKADGSELGELTTTAMDSLGIVATWTASVANRKLNTWSNATPVVEATASAVSGETKRLEGANPWRPGTVWLGEITGDGLFVPPRGGVYRKTPNSTIPPYGAHERDNGVLDTTSDGSISVTLASAGNIPVVPACVIVAPQDHSPDVGPGQIGNDRNKDFVIETRNLLGIPGNVTLVGAGYAMDMAMMKTINAEYSPGMEICLESAVAIPRPKDAFYVRGQEHIHANEIRPRYAPGGAKLGQLTAGLCSTWQTDLNACLNYWTSSFPNKVGFDTAPVERYLARKIFTAEGPQNTNPEWLNVNIDRMDVARDVENDISFLHGTERTASDDVGEVPVAPFPLDPT